MRKKRIVVSVISDLVSDQRVHRVCSFLHENSFDVLLIGRRTINSISLEQRAYATERIYCHFSRGTLGYAEFHFRLFVRLIFRKADLFLSNDLDTLLPNFIHARLRGKKLVYDSHEYFTGTPELQHKPFKRKIWQSLEGLLLPRIKKKYTVNYSVAQQYKENYKVDFKVVRNVPLYTDETVPSKETHFPKDKFILLLQGAGINTGRGGEELIQSMLYLPEEFFLVIIGSGDCWNQLVDLSYQLNLEKRIMFIQKVPFQKLKQYTAQAHLGLSLDKPLCLNNELSLPNKIFDYIHAGLPIIASSIYEVKKIIEQYNVGLTIDKISPETIAKVILDAYTDKDRYQLWKANTVKAAKELNWQNEQKTLREIFDI